MHWWKHCEGYGEQMRACVFLMPLICVCVCVFVLNMAWLWKLASAIFSQQSAVAHQIHLISLNHLFKCETRT